MKKWIELEFPTATNLGIPGAYLLTNPKYEIVKMADSENDPDGYLEEITPTLSLLKYRFEVFSKGPEWVIYHSMIADRFYFHVVQNESAQLYAVVIK